MAFRRSAVRSRSAPPSRRISILVGAALLLVLAAVAGVALMPGRDAGFEIGGPFQLVGGDGKLVTDRDFRGRWMLIYFGYTSCPDVCPTTLTQIAAALDRLGPDADKIRPVFITIDPKRDTPNVVREYAAAFSPRLVGLTGSPEQIAKVEADYRVFAAEHRTGNGPNDYTMDHSSILYLAGPDGHLVGPLNAEATAAELATKLRAAIGSSQAGT